MRLRHWSHSAVGSLLDGCGWQFALERFLRHRVDMDHPRAAVGTAFHAAVETHERSRQQWHYSSGLVGSKDGVPRDVMHAVADANLRAAPVQWMIHSLDDTLDEVRACVDHWWDATIPKKQPGEGGTLRDRVMGWRPVAIELPFQFWSASSARPFRGVADGVYLGEYDDVLVVDQKQAKHFRNYPHDGSKNRLQAAAYSFAAVEAANLPARRSQGYWPRVEFHISRAERGTSASWQGVRVVAVDPDEPDINLVRNRLRIADRRVAAGEFVKNPSWFLCKGEWCPFHPDSHEPGFRGLCSPLAPNEFPVDVVGEPLPMLTGGVGAGTV